MGQETGPWCGLDDGRAEDEADGVDRELLDGAADVLGEPVGDVVGVVGPDEPLGAALPVMVTAGPVGVTIGAPVVRCDRPTTASTTNTTTRAQTPSTARPMAARRRSDERSPTFGIGWVSGSWDGGGELIGGARRPSA